MGGRGSGGGGGSNKGAGGSTEDRILAAIDRLASGSGWTSMADLRDSLTGLSRAEQDAALRQMLRAGKIRIIPVAEPGKLTARERAAAIMIGGEANEVIRVVR